MLFIRKIPNSQRQGIPLESTHIPTELQFCFVLKIIIFSVVFLLIDVRNNLPFHECLYGSEAQSDIHIVS